MTGLPWYRVPAALLDACEAASVLTEREAVLDLCARVWIGDEPSRDGLQRGEARVTHGQLADAWGWSRHKVRSFLRKLEKTNEISTLGDGRATIVRLTQLGRKLDANLTQPRRKRIEEIQEVTGRLDANLTQPRRNGDATLTQPIYREREEREETREDQKQQAAPPLGDASAPPDPSTKAGRARLYPALVALPREGTRYVYPEPFERFRAAYPDSARRAPGPATYRDWRALVVAGADPEALVRAATGHAIESGGKFARRAHGPSGWLRSGEWEALADAAPRDPLRAANPHAEHHETATAEHVAPVVEALPETGCAVWRAVRAELEQVLPVAAACVGCVEGGDLVIRTRDEIAEIALRKRVAIVEAVASRHWAGEIRIALV